MSDDMRTREAIERGETWFARVCGRCEPIDTDAIKQRLRIEIGEQWLARKLIEADDPQLEERIRGKVRASIGNAWRKARAPRGDAKGSRSTASRLYWAAASAVGIAATLLLTFGDLLDLATSINKVSEEIEASYVDAFEQYQGDDWDTTFGDLSDEFESFVSASASESALGSESVEWGSDSSGGWFDADSDSGTTDG